MKPQRRIGTMKLKLWSVVLISILFFSSCANNREPEEKKEQPRSFISSFSVLPLSGAKQVYTIKSGPYPLGSATFQVQSESPQKMSIHYSCSIPTSGLKEESQITFNSDTFQPIESWKNIDAGKEKVRISCKYEGNKADLRLDAPDGKKSQTLLLPDNTIDNEQLLILLQTFKFSDKYPDKLNVFSLQSAAAIPLEMSLEGQEKKTTPAGSFDCYKVKISIPDYKEVQYAWYNVTSPFQLIWYDNGKIQYELASYEPGAASGK